MSTPANSERSRCAPSGSSASKPVIAYGCRRIRPACTASTRTAASSSGLKRWRTIQPVNRNQAKMYLEKFRLGGRVAVVTGAGQGIGLACAEALGEAGATVILADRDPKAAETARAGLAAKGLDVEVAVMDVTDSKRVSEVADQLAAKYGKIDILVNNAGIARSETPAEKVTDEHWLNVIDVNLNGTFWCCRAFGKHMLDAGS